MKKRLCSRDNAFFIASRQSCGTVEEDSVWKAKPQSLSVSHSKQTLNKVHGADDFNMIQVWPASTDYVQWLSGTFMLCQKARTSGQGLFCGRPKQRPRDCQSEALSGRVAAWGALGVPFVDGGLPLGKDANIRINGMF